MAKESGEDPGLIAQLQRAIRDSGKSLYQLSKESGVPNPQLYRFMSGERTLTLPAAEKICRALHLALIQAPSVEELETQPCDSEPGEAPAAQDNPKRGRKMKGT